MPGGVFEEVPEGAPIEPGTVFDPEWELKEVLRVSGKERKRKFEEYKEKFHYQQRGLEEMQKDLQARIIENPDQDTEELFVPVVGFSKKYGFTMEQLSKTLSVLSGYSEKRADIREVLSEFSNEGTPPIDEKALFKALFSSSPQGKIEIESGPVSIFIRCYDELDFMRAVKVSSLLTDGMERGDIFRMSLGSKAINLPKTLVSSLDNAVTLENFEMTLRETKEDKESAKRDSRNSFLHEQQHTIYSLLDPDRAEPSVYLNEALTTKDEEDRYVAARLYFKKDVLPQFFARIKDEALAQITGNFSSEEIKKKIERFKQDIKNGGFYDFRANEGKKIVSVFSKKLAREGMISVLKATDEIFGGKYDAKADEALDALSELISRGYTAEQAKAKLLFVPLDKWGKMVSRIEAKAS